MTTFTKQELREALEDNHEITREVHWSFETEQGIDGAPGDRHGSMVARLSLPGGVSAQRVVLWQHPTFRGSEVSFDDDEARWDFDGLTVLDENGEQLDDADLAELLQEYTDICEAPEGYFVDDVTQLDDGGDEEGEMEEFVIARDNAPNLCFHGKLLARVSTSPNSAHGSDYSGSPGRWSTLKIYRTRGGKYVCAKVGHTQWQGEKTRYSGAVCNTEREVIDFFGHGWLSKDLYEEAGIDDVELID